MHLAGGERAALEIGDAAAHRRSGHVVRRHDDHRRARRARERALDGAERLHDRQALRERVEARVRRVHVERRQGDDDEARDRDERGGAREAQRRAEDEIPHARLAVAPLQPAERAPVDAVAEAAEERGQHRERSDHRDEHDEDRAEAHRDEVARAGERHAGAGDGDGEAGDEHGAAGGRGGGVQRLARLASPRPLLALAAEIEERVVDADRHPHEDDDARRRVRRMDDVADDGAEADRREHRREREQHGQAGGDERAEREQEDGERHRHRRQLGVLQIRVDDVVRGVVRARVARPPGG